MRIRNILAQRRSTLSFEALPPKTEDVYDTVERAAAKIATLKLDFMSVTYGTGGGTNDYTVGITPDIQKSGVTSLAHLTCMPSTRDKVHSILEELKSHGIEDALALGGDIPADGQAPREYHYTSELTHEIRQSGDFCTGAACCPEGHVELTNKSVDVDYLRGKVGVGRDSVTTQIFFDSDILYSYLYRTREKGVTVLVIAGTMPMTSAKQIKRITQMSDTYPPSRFLTIVDKFGDNPTATRQVGIAYAADQIIDLTVNGVRGIHAYSMNKPGVTTKIRENLSEILQEQGVLAGGKDEYRRH